MSAEQKMQVLELYPNPTHREVTIELAATSGIHSLTIVDILGRVMLQTPVRLNERTLMLDVSAYPRGMYILQCRKQNNTVLQKHFIVDR
jgi:hypothetical protein